MQKLTMTFMVVLMSASSAHADKSDLAAAKMVVHDCVNSVRAQAKRPENFQFGQPPMWKNFDAYLSPDGRIYNNTHLEGEAEGVYLFNKCLAAHGYSVK